ncbi:hypothetical protein GDO86_005991 [Hymenochirus boettgeri]|uniref:Uncharacterized protein n=1 Tax=Hymenochirus boettgeri TaxID=247094 RepID=A0A8T2J497_9PIPI|nr:hypothetical protein GDO86_005991 [Hymenochirus boettgeri]
MICKMSNVKNLEDEDILDHAMKIIHLLTGQNYIVVKKPEENSITLRNEGLILEPVLYSVVHESNKGRNLCYGRMLQLVDLIIQLLAEELSCSSDFIEEAKDAERRINQEEIELQ